MSYQLTIHNDEEHSVAYVTELLVRELGLPIEEAAAFTAAVDREGRGSVPMADLAAAQRAQEKVFNVGPDPRIPTCRGSLVVSIEEDGKVVNCGRVTDKGFERIDAADLARSQARGAHACSCPGTISAMSIVVVAFVILSIVVPLIVIALAR
jgi:hypothetical protein